METLRPRTKTHLLLLFFSDTASSFGCMETSFSALRFKKKCLLYLIHQKGECNPGQLCYKSALVYIETENSSPIGKDSDFWKKAFFKQKKRKENLRSAEGKKGGWLQSRDPLGDPSVTCDQSELDLLI